MTRHLKLSVEQILKTALDGEDLTYSTAVVSGDGREVEKTKIHFEEDSETVRRLLMDDTALAMRKYPEIRRRAFLQNE